MVFVILVVEVVGGKIMMRYYIKVVIKNLVVGKSVYIDKFFLVGFEYVESVL